MQERERMIAVGHSTQQVGNLLAEKLEKVREELRKTLEELAKAQQEIVMLEKQLEYKTYE